MTKRHFEAFAKQIKSDLASGRRFTTAEYLRTWDACLYAASTFADVASSMNGRFDRDRFMVACGLTPNVNPHL
jgi:hypothetical protein